MYGHINVVPSDYNASSCVIYEYNTMLSLFIFSNDTEILVSIFQLFETNFLIKLCLRQG